MLAGDYSGGLTFNATTLLNVERIVLADSVGYQFTTDQATVGAGQRLTVDGSALSTGHNLVFLVAPSESDGNFTVTGGDGDDEIDGGPGGNDVLGGGDGDDNFHLTTYTGNAGDHADTVNGGAGDDLVFMGATLDAADRIDGGVGTNDNLLLDGDYSRGLIFAATTMINVEAINMAALNSYSLTTDDATVAAGVVLTVDASPLLSGNTLIFNGHAETDGSFQIIGGAGNDVLIGGQGADLYEGNAGNDQLDLSSGGSDTAVGGAGGDTIQFGATFDSSDLVDGGGDYDIVQWSGDYTGGNAVVFGLLAFVNVEEIDLLNGNSYSLTTDDTTVAARATLEVDAHDLQMAGNKLTFNGSAETDGSFRIIGGSGDDVLTGGTRGDYFLGGVGDDTIDGGGGNDTADYSDRVGPVAVILSRGVLADVVVNGVVEDHIQNIENVIGGSDNDSLVGDSAANLFDLSHGGDDTANGSGGNDTFVMGAALTADDAIDGGSNTDVVSLDGAYAAGLTLGATTLLNVEVITLADGNSYKLTTDDATVAGGKTLTVDGSNLTSGNYLIFTGSHETDGGFVIMGGLGDDTFFINGAAVLGASQIDGGDLFSPDTDTLLLTGAFPSFTFGADTIRNIESLVLGTNGDYNLTMADSLALFQHLGVDASALDASHHLTFDGSAEGNGHFDITSGNGADTLTGGHGNDEFIYTGVTLSGATRDTINGFDFTGDKIVFAHPSSIDATVTTGTLTAASFDSDLTAAIASLQDGHAILFTPNAGDFVGETFLVVDSPLPGDAGYQSGSDLVIQLHSPQNIGSIDSFDFLS
jgi:Ca2+-binding RTX toxin-like protein